jgi:acyl transferase domain-containing protein/acyl carrier protein
MNGGSEMSSGASGEERRVGVERKVARGEIQEWLLARLSSIVGLPADQIDARAPFSRYGLDSLGAIDLVASLAEWLGRDLAPTLLWDCPNVAALSDHLAGPDSPEELPKAGADTAPPRRDEPIAVIGIGCRFPGAPDPEAFWRLLCEEASAIREVPADRWDWRAFTSPDASAPGKMTSNLGGFLDRIDAFDHAFFGISPREAARMDPQQRLLLEVAWEALEDAGIPADRLSGSKTGVFVGVLTSDYADMALASPRHIDAYSGTGSLACVAANRISYAFDFAGPSMAIDAACSSSLVAVHAACESIRRGECEAALAGGVNVIALPTHALVMTKAGALSPDGRCYSFDARANGYVRGEGTGVVVLKALSKALADGDPIYAVIRGSAVNHGGRSNGLTAPRQRAQEELLREAYRAAGVSPGDVQYVEAHGTGTPLGDPIECKALGAVLAEGRGKGSTCSIGSVKTNVGHLEAAAGVAGLIKVALALKHGEIPASLNFETPNPHIPFDSLPLRVQVKRGSWAPGPRIAGVSSFGLGGTNAHVVLEEAPARDEASKGGGRRGRAALGEIAHVIPLSAHSPEALRALAEACRRSFSSTLEPGALADLSHTAGLRRQHYSVRAALVVRSREELLDSLSALSRDESRPSVVKVEKPRASASNTNTNANISINRNTKGPVFVFSGQGPQWFAMGRGLMKTEPAFREVMEACDGWVRKYGGFSLLEELQADEQSSRVHESHVVQPALFAIQIALAALWRSYGVEPGAVLGHSGGEIAAAYVAGILELEEAVRLSVRRGRIMASAIGRTAAVALSPEEALREINRCGGRVSIAAINSPTATTLSGDAEPLDALIESLDRRGIFARALRVKCAAHSHLLEGAKEELRAAIADLVPRPPRVPIVSTLTGEMAGPGDYTPSYWARQMREPVQFAKAVGTLAAQGFSVFLECNPHPVLAGSIAECFGWRGEKPLVIPSLRRGDDDRTTFLAAVGALYTAGYSIEWGASLGVFEADGPKGFELIRFPLYPFQRERCWLEPELLAALRSGDRGIGDARHPLLGRHIRSASASGLMLWEIDVDRSTLSYIDDHKVQEARVFQSLTYVEMVLAAARETLGEGPFAASKIAFRRALFVPDEGRRTIRLEVVPNSDGGAAFSIYSRPAGDASAAFTLHVTGSLTPEESDRHEAAADRGEILKRCRDELSGEAFYEKLRSLGNQYGPRFQGVARIFRRDGEALGEIRVPDLLKDEVPLFGFHPAVLDACGQVLLAADREGSGFMPVVIDRIRVFDRPSERLFSHVEVRGGAGGDELVGDVRVYSEDGRLVAEMLGSHLQYLDRIGAQKKPSLDDSIYEIAWKPADEKAGKPALREVTGAGAWIVLADRGGVGEGLAARIRQGGRRCVIVQRGDRFVELGRDRFAMSEGARDDLRRIFERLGADGGPGVAGAVHLFSLDVDATSDLLSAQRGASASYLMLLQEAARLRKPPRVWAATRGAQAARPGEALPGLASSPIWGLGRTAALELPSVWGGLIDLDPGSSDADAAEALAKELERPGREDQIALREKSRLVARLVRREARPERPMRLRADASYLVTGGLGSLGLKVARWLSEQGARRVILMGRTPLPPRSSWRDAAPGSRLAEQVAEIRAIEALGVSVVTAAVDVADENALREFLDHYDREGWPAIRGVVHAAGVAGLCPLTELSASALDADFRGKALGAKILDRLLGDLDFCVYYSSLSAILASPLLGGYAAANTFLDALAHDRRARGKPALSLNWGFWAEGGMASRHKEEQGRRALPRGMDEFSPEQALAVQGRLLREGASQAMIGIVHWPEYGASYPAAAALPLFDEILRGPAAAAPQPTRENGASIPPASGEKLKLSRAALLGEVPEVRQQRVVEFLGSEVARVLRIPVWKMEPHVPLSNLGIDSMMATELKNGIEASIGVVLPLVRFLKGPTVHDLAGDIMSSLPSEPAPELLPAAPRAQAAPSLAVLSPLGAGPNAAGEEPEGLGDIARAEDLLRRIDHLSDDEVSLLLEQMLEGGAECA